MSLLDAIRGKVNSDAIGQTIEEMVDQAIIRRKPHERRWYDNNFFDDGFHFRTISRRTGQIIDHAARTNGYVERAIPRASRQIRGVSNLLFAAEPYPVVYPKRISMSQYPPVQNPETGEEMPNPEYEKAVKQAKEQAQKQGIWLSNEWNDEQELNVKLIDALIKAAKNAVSWVQVSSDTKNQKIITDVFDAFDVVCFGDYDDERKLPFITKIRPRDLAELTSDSDYSEETRSRLVPDNKYATSEIKDAYMRARYGNKTSDKYPTVLEKETFMKEYLTDENWEDVKRLSEETGAMEHKSKGDMVMRHVFSAGGVTLDDEYIDYDEYPLIPVRFEPGALYQVPFIERFIPQNKSLDIIVTRLEKFINSMVVGVYQARKGENFEITNFPGGQKIEYETSPAQQMNVASPTNAPFQMIELLQKFMDEQGASTSTLGQIPTGVKANKAIENIKASEYANLKIPTLMLKQSIKRISECMLERADKDFLRPLEVSSIEDGEPNYFDVIGQRGLELNQKVGAPLPDDVVPLSRKTKIRIEIEAGLGLTMEGKKDAMDSIIQNMILLYDKGFIAPEAMQQVIKKYLETFGYGSTEEFMEAMEEGVTAGQMSDNQIKQMQIAIAKTLQDAGVVGPEADKKLVTASKIGTLASLKDAGLVDKINEGGQPDGITTLEELKEMAKIYKDAPPDVRREIEIKLGLPPSEIEKISPSQADTANKVKTATETPEEPDPEDKDQERDLKEREMRVKERQAEAKPNES